MADTETQKETPSSGAEPQTAAVGAAAIAAARPPLVLKRGARIRLGYRQGTVEIVRGGWRKPYDILVRWESEKYPRWLIYATVERDYQGGHLTVL